ncbi:Cut8 six-helix bundle-domain-containing protein [Halteromyces radiatus]|uniref:Cut8 six-helix bundle-domain-containing protein n=1 Tax=Halteromyces radiatus TaxID=101107 RepID=UPI00222004A2|nr:Cut8 six-helix bundle-domain-containing protein [Halteromyces radiatus]KAI8092531.1 Cut8 six-helix bundle-domain-containing protein [Halteromyces radiatus]
MSSQNSIFRQQQHLYRSSHYLTPVKQPTFYIPPSPSNTHSAKGRKRRASEDEEMTIADVLVDHSSTNINTNVTLTTSTDRHKEVGDIRRIIKRNRTGIEKQFPISKLLATLEKDKLIELINDLVDANPHLQPEIDAHLPQPTTQSVSILINKLETKLGESYPLHKSGKGRDDYSFHRVKPALMEVVHSLIEYADHFTSSNEHPTTIFSYLHYATCTAHRLPTWDNEVNNQYKRDLYDELLQRWEKAVELAGAELEQGKIFGHQVVTEWAKQIAYHDAETHDLFGKVKQRFIDRLGWVIGMDNGPSSTSSSSSSTSKW